MLPQGGVFTRISWMMRYGTALVPHSTGPRHWVGTSMGLCDVQLLFL